MTAISTIISKRGISFATDSIITIYNKRKNYYEAIEFEKSKIISIEKYHAALAYYGFAKYNRWNIYDWIKKQIQNYSSALDLSQFADQLKKDLDNKLDEFFSDKFDINRGIGIHLAGYEEFDGRLLPEMYHISNFKNPEYKEIRHMSVGPQLYKTLPLEYKINNSPTLQQRRQAVFTFIENGRMFIYNNGDPKMFNPLSNSFRDAYLTLKDRQLTKTIDLELQLSLTRRPIEFIKKAQIDFCEKGKRLVGGKIHDLSFNKFKIYKSNTGDY